ncbi:hypothetical protein HK100_010259 [Physocladia obscura]|uniref:Methyltransferase type 11 domain-containing protein n=1 Tax=Physocladia obscura TaxID=109957 RepID=A0AAD5T9U5_9FUNG|nr:hypothetical protein HK100_010259 [Physocladia obscura]
MSETAKPTDPTFRTYTTSQAAAYAAGRGGYTRTLYDEILDRHEASGGAFTSLLDVGCGTGSATRDLATRFTVARGVDPGESMIAIASQLGGTTATGALVEFSVIAAEDIASTDGLGPESVDLVTAAMALKSLFLTDPSTPNATRVQQILSHLEDVILAPYVLPQNLLSRNLYRALPLPWDTTPSIDEFDKNSYVRVEWDADGILSNGIDFFGGSDIDSLADLANSLGTASMVTRWREANPELVGTDKDCVTQTMKELKEALDANDLETTTLKTGAASVLILVKKHL